MRTASKGSGRLAAEQILGESVLRRNQLVDERQMRNGRLLPDPIEDAVGYARHVVRIFALANRGDLQEPGQPWLHAQRRKAS